MIKVSVIVPICNMEKYLKKCLDSLLCQTLQEIEIIAVDDGSTDTSPGILAEYAAKSRKIIHLTKENGGLSDARNFGLPYATGEYIGFVDSDDYTDDDMFESMYVKAKESDSDIVECNLHHDYGGYEDTETVPRYYDKSSLLCFGRTVVWNKIYRRLWLLGTGVVFPKGLIYEDVSFYIKLIPHITGYAYADIAPIHYVWRQGSINNASSDKTLHICVVLRDIVSYYKENGFYELFSQELEFFYARILLCSSLSRICRIPDKMLRKSIIRRNWNELISVFPKWRKNGILRRQRSRQALYMRTVNWLTYRVYGLALPAYFWLRDRSKRLKAAEMEVKPC